MMTLFGILLLFFAFLGLFSPWIKKAFESYLRQKRYVPILNKINFLYHDINPFEISLKARSPKSSFIYGEISLCTLLDLLEITHPQKNETFMIEDRDVEKR